MEESTLLMVAITVSIVGVIALWILPETPEEKFPVHLVWTNGTHAWGYPGEPSWIEFRSVYKGPVDRCIILEGRRGSGISGHPLPGASPDYHRCR